jgi:type IV secretory pathway VirB10-like protein
MPTSLRSNCFILAVIASVFGTSLAFAQSNPPSTTVAPKHESARERRKALEEESAQKQRRREEWDKRTLEAIEARDRKRTDCRMQAKEQNLHLMKRLRFIRKCMASGSPR